MKFSEHEQWLEKNLTDQYLAWYKVNDMPNAIVLWGKLAPYEYARRTGGLPKLNLALPSIVSAFQPKSGGTFIFNRLVVSFGYKEYWWGITHQIDQASVYAVPESIELYMRGGCVTHSHCRPSPYNIRVFDQYRVPQVWVHLRHPAESTLSAYYHYLGYGQGAGELGEMRRQLNMQHMQDLRITVGTGDANERDEFLLKHLNSPLLWMLTWIRFAERHPERVFFTYFPELVHGTIFPRICSHFGIAPISPIENRLDADRIRGDGRSDWRRGLRRDTVEKVESILNEALGHSGILENL